MSSTIDIADHPRWLPLPLEAGPDWFVGAVLQEFGPEAADAASVVAGVMRTLAVDTGEGPMTIAGWALMADGEDFRPLSFATLQAIPTEPDAATDPEALATDLAAGEELFSAPLVTAVDTASGPATSVRLRPMVDVDGEAQVHQTDAVVWPRPERQAIFVLSHYGTDLVTACHAGDLLVELASGVGGL